jgi:sugar phosphate isomerase/epimerase
MKQRKKEIFMMGFQAVIFTAIVTFASGCQPKQEVPLLTEIGVCTGYTNGAILVQHGYSYIEESVGRFLMPDKSDEEFNAVLEQAKNSVPPVKACNGFIPGSLKSVGPEAVHPQILEYMETAFRRAQKAGVEHIVFGSGGSRSIPDGFSKEEARSQFVGLCSAMAPIAARYNVIVVLEPLNTREVNFINSVAEGAGIVEEVNHPNFRLLADIYHMMMEDESPEDIITYGHLIKHVHIAEKEGRAAPGTHGEDFRPYFSALKEIGYPGRISVECRWEDLESQAESVITAIKQQVADVMSGK